MKPKPHIFKGNKNYKSIVIGHIRVLKQNNVTVPKYKINDTQKEIDNLLDAIKNVKQEVELLQNKINPEKEKDIYAIFDFYKMYLEDDYYIKDAIDEIKSKKLNAAYIIEERHKKTISFFDKIEDIKMRERQEDINFLTQKVLGYLLKNNNSKSSNFSKKEIIFAKTISPLDLILYHAQGVQAIVTEGGSFTSHTSIIANTLDISYIMGINNCLKKVNNNDTAIIDGFTGEIFINPDSGLISQYKIKQKKQENILTELEEESLSKSFTKDNKYIRIMSNIDVIDAPEKINKHNFEGIGLARSEFMFHDRERIPSYEEQLTIYKELLLKNKDIEVTIRTFDFSEDKTPNTLKVFSQHNPSMGLRGIRFSFYQKIFKIQLKALIVSAQYGNLKILFPMISSYEEFIEIKKIETEILNELDIKKNYKLGIMIETISSIYILNDIHDEIDFVSLGTNDLMQYFFAVDRSNSFVNYLSSPFAPSFIRFLNDLTTIIKKYDIELSICGKIASIPNMIPVLIGINLEILSVSPLSTPIVKRIIKKISYQKSKELVLKLINNKTSQQNEALINEFFKENNINLGI